MVYDIWDSVATREVSVDKKVDLKFIQVKILKKYSKDDKETVCSCHVIYAF